MRVLATTVSGSSQQAYLKQAAEWRRLADELKQEILQVDPNISMDSAVFAPTREIDKGAATSPDEVSRILQLKIDWDSSTTEDYAELFEKYTLSGEMNKATALLDALQREIVWQELLKSVAPTVQQEADVEGQLAKLRELKEKFESSLQDPTGVAP